MRTSAARRLIALVVAVIAIQGSYWAVAITLPIVLDRAGYEEAEIGLLIGSAFLAQLVTAIYIGPAIDARGPRATLLWGAGLYLLATSILFFVVHEQSSLYHVLVARLVQGAGFGVVLPSAFAATTAIIAPPRRGLALGLVTIAHNISQALFPIAALAMLSALGFQHVVVAALGILLIGVVLVPVAAAQSAQNVKMASFSKPKLPWLMPHCLILLMMLPWGALLAFLPVRADDAGVFAGTFFAADATALVLARLPAGIASDKMSAHGLLIFGSAATAVGLATLVASPALASLVIAGLLTGLGTAFISIPVLALLSARSSDGTRGSAFALYSVFHGIGGAIGSIGGGLALPYIGFNGLMMGSIGAMLLAVVLVELDRKAISRLLTPR